MRKTKIICTIGPASESEERLKELMLAGMNVARFNFSHGTHEEQKVKLTRVIKVSNELGLPVATLLDTKGPEIRLKDFEGGKAMLEAGQQFTLTTDEVMGTAEKASITYKNLKDDVKKGMTILIDDGKIEMTIEKITENDIVCRVINGGAVSNHKGINAPGAVLSMPYISDVDRADITFCAQMGFDFLAASFARCKEDILEVRKILDEHKSKAKIIAKIENMQGIDNLDEILEVSDGIMVARGDMGVEIPAQDVIFAQKHIIKRCNQVGKPVITATQMLDSMIKNPRPTRAEAGDVTNAILDGTDAVMLSGESAKGKYPREAVRTMNTICERTDSYCEENHGKVFPAVVSAKTVTDSACLAAVEAADALNVPVIVVATEHGNSARAIRKFNPKAEILALTPNVKAARQLCVTRGVMPKIVDRISSTDEFLQLGKKLAVEMGLAKAGDKIVMVNGALVPSGITNTMSVQTI